MLAPISRYLFLRLFFVFVAGIAFSACSAKYKNQNPIHQPFPTVQGKSLNGDLIDIPRDLLAEKVVFLVGFKQNSQFDIDRWLLGLFDSKVEIPIYEIPTITGIVPGMIAGRIDDGMRSGIPQDLWQSVITVYTKNAKQIAQFCGNEKPNNARVFLLDQEAKVLFFDDQGYSVASLRKLTGLLNE